MKLPCLIKEMDFEAYLDDPAPAPSLTSSIVKKMLSSTPRHVWEENRRLNPDFEEEQKSMFDLGAASHHLLIGGGADLAVVDAKAWNTKVAKAARAAAYEEGLTPILEHQMERAEAMAEVAEFEFVKNKDIGFLFHADTPMEPEASIFWDEGGICCRCRPDIYYKKKGEAPIIVHYKTTEVKISAHTLHTYAANQHWDVIHVHYHAGVKALTGESPRQYFAIQENKPPYLCMVANLDGLFVSAAELLRKQIVQTWKYCLEKSFWPGHDINTLTLYPPPWHENEKKIEAYEEKVVPGYLEGVKALHGK